MAQAYKVDFTTRTIIITAELEREYILQRQKEGIAIAKAKAIPHRKDAE